MVNVRMRGGHARRQLGATWRRTGDMAGQIQLTMDNVEALLASADVDLQDVLRLTIYVTDMPAALAAYSVITDRLDAHCATPPATLVEVKAFAVPGMSVEIEATAGH